ncbi:sensor histidine kinase [Campylobacter estrildidarum]|uniref:histidine kinase n=1 Tax=Campylobacter estrildidarum TaxID=2510189 RepID=A0A4U7BEF7_9BACT|nr:ATP-binding protein [Campylobacter estrildidarum]TKX30003.1 hypothetical protein CQA69_06670 [Campylobacter estrildidarum]
MRLYLKFSTKTKTMILVIVLFILTCIVFSFLRQIDIRNLISLSKEEFKGEIANIYTTTLKRTKEFYTSRAKANLESDNIKNYIKNQDIEKIKILTQARFKVLKEENPYLLNMKFFNNQGQLLTFLGIKNRSLNPKNAKNEYFFLDKDILTYHILTPFYEKNKLLGWIEFCLAAEYFLKEIQDFSELKGNIVFNKEYQDGNLITKGSQTFILHSFTLFDVDDKQAKMIFYQDITEQEDIIKKSFIEALILSLFLILIILLILHYGFKVLIKRLEISENSLRHLNANLEQKIQIELQKRREQERILMHQSRLASMGEMIGNIAHQWRQPLTELSAIITHLGLMMELKRLDCENFKKQEKSAENLISYMSKTIDDFRNFFKPNTEKIVFSIEKTLDKTLKLLESSFKEHSINVKKDFKEEIEFYGFQNQFSQAILNILCNAKDVLIERKIKNPCIKISLTRENQNIFIKIKDNGGGITISPVEKIFEPYISTKHANMGTGIGLYMSKVIIEKNFKGNLYAENKDNGAEFTINLILTSSPKMQMKA